MTRGVDKFDEPFVGIFGCFIKKYAKIPAVRCPKPRHGGRQGIRFGRHRGLAWVWANQLKACCSYRRSGTVMCNKNLFEQKFVFQGWNDCFCCVLIFRWWCPTINPSNRCVKNWWIVEVMIVNLFFVGNLLGQMIVWCRWRKIPCTLMVRKAVGTEGFLLENSCIEA